MNHADAHWLQERDIERTRSGCTKKNDQTVVELKNNYVVRKRTFYWRNDITQELALLANCGR